MCAYQVEETDTLTFTIKVTTMILLLYFVIVVDIDFVSIRSLISQHIYYAGNR